MSSGQFIFSSYPFPNILFPVSLAIKKIQVQRSRFLTPNLQIEENPAINYSPTNSG